MGKTSFLPGGGREASVLWLYPAKNGCDQEHGLEVRLGMLAERQKGSF